MRLTVVNPSAFARGSATALAPVRPAGKASDSAAFGDGRFEAPPEMPRQRPRLQVELVCQDGTKPHDPFWDAPRLLPVFVTQLLGQILPQSPQPARLSAYAASVCRAPVFDARI